MFNVYMTSASQGASDYLQPWRYINLFAYLLQTKVYMVNTWALLWWRGAMSSVHTFLYRVYVPLPLPFTFFLQHLDAVSWV